MNLILYLLDSDAKYGWIFIQTNWLID